MIDSGGKPVKIVVCGNPGSGNHIIGESLMLSEDVDSFGTVHGTSQACKTDDPRNAILDFKKFEAKGFFLIAVVPVRSPEYPARSLERRDYPPYYEADEYHQMHRNMLAALFEHGLPFSLVGYEAFVDEPVNVCNNILRWAGLAEIDSVGKEIFNANKRYKT